MLLLFKGCSTGWSLTKPGPVCEDIPDRSHLCAIFSSDMRGVTSAGRKEWDFKANVPFLLQIHTLYLAASLTCCVFHQNPLKTKQSLHMGNDGDAHSMVEKYGQQRCIVVVKEPFVFVS